MLKANSNPFISFRMNFYKVNILYYVGCEMLGTALAVHTIITKFTILALRTYKLELLQGATIIIIHVLSTYIFACLTIYMR